MIGARYTGYCLYRHRLCPKPRDGAGVGTVVRVALPGLEAWPEPIACPGCGRQIHGERMYGRVSTRHLCSPKCTGAYGPSCDCSCGGRNHGGRFSPADFASAAGQGALL